MSIASEMYKCNTSEWETPQDVFDYWRNEYHLNLDIAASRENHKCESYYTKEEDAFEHIDEWRGNIWCNPPYGKGLERWVEACANYSNGIAVMLIPVRTGAKWWKELIWNNPKVERIHFFDGHLRSGDTKKKVYFYSCIVVFNYKRADDARTPEERLNGWQRY